MRGRSKKHRDSQVVRRIMEGVQSMRDALRKEQPLPACAKFVLTSFVNKLCSVHRERVLCDRTEERPICGDHHYLYIVLRLTYEIHLTVKTIVSMLLREIFLCEGSLQIIFSMLSDPDCRTCIHANMLYPSLSQASDRSAFGFFVSSICPLDRDVRERGETIYSPNNVLNTRFLVKAKPTTPLLAATKFNDPDLVLLLLRHGADPLVCDRGDSMVLSRKSPVGAAIDTLNIFTMLRGSAWRPLYSGAGTWHHMDETIEKALLCLTYFSRAVFALDVRQSTQTVDTANYRSADDSSRTVHYEVRPNILEIIDLSAFRQPPSLRHACRYVIRDAVSRAGKESIPEAIHLLQLPSLLAEFLDLHS